MSDPASVPTRLRLADLAQDRPNPFELVPDTAAMEALAAEMGLSALRKLRFAGDIRAQGKRDWRIDATLGATLVQPCVVTLDPVTTRIDVPVARLYLADYAEPDGSEIEMPEDDTVEALPDVLDLEALMAEALALNIPAYPRKTDVDPVTLVHTEPGKTALRDEDLRPFASLAELRDKLVKDD